MKIEKFLKFRRTVFALLANRLHYISLNRHLFQFSVLFYNSQRRFFMQIMRFGCRTMANWCCTPPSTIRTSRSSTLPGTGRRVPPGDQRLLQREQEEQVEERDPGERAPRRPVVIRMPTCTRKSGPYGKSWPH